MNHGPFNVGHFLRLCQVTHCSFSTSVLCFKIVPSNMKGKSKSSQDWLQRQLNDPYVKLAQQKNYRARSAFKLEEIDEKFKIFSPGQIVVDCGAAPGSWTQVIVPKINSLGEEKSKPQGVVIGIDLAPIHPTEGAILLSCMDFTLPSTQEHIYACLDRRKVDVVVSDMAPHASGMHQLDHDNIISLAYSALKFALTYTKVDGHFICKIWNGARMSLLNQDMQKFYKFVRTFKPHSSRNDSSEMYFIAMNKRKTG